MIVDIGGGTTDIAVISLSETKLKKQAEDGDKKAKKLLALTQAPDNFLSAIQIAITLAGFLSSVYKNEDKANNGRAGSGGRRIFPPDQAKMGAFCRGLYIVSKNKRNVRQNLSHNPLKG